MRNSTCSLWAFINKLISKFSASLATEKSLQCLLICFLSFSCKLQLIFLLSPAKSSVTDDSCCL